MGKIYNFKKFQFQPFQSRMDNIQVRNFWMDKGTPKPFTSYEGPKFSHFEIVKWEPNPYYGKYDDYIKDGYEESFGGDFLQKPGHSIQKTFFDKPESCYVIAYWVDMDHDEMSPDLKFVGSRPFELDPQEKVYFMQLAEITQKEIENQLRQNEEDEEEY
jgi:hypothetical protein